MKAIKKIMDAVLLSLSMVVSFVPMNVFAVEAVDIWDGTADTSWYVGHEVDSEYHITTAEQLAGLAQLVNGYLLEMVVILVNILAVLLMVNITK